MVPSHHLAVRLWGAILVAIPTAIPEAPFTNRLGILAGSTEGSFKESSKLGWIIDRILIDIRQQLFRHSAQPWLPCNAWLPVNHRPHYQSYPGPSTNVYLKGPFLGHTHHGIIYSTVSPWGWYLPNTSPTIRADFL